jgi:hypothetical protein
MMGMMLLESVKSLSSTRENAVLQWAVKFNSALATEENWHLKDHEVKENVNYFLKCES